jgi:FAD:protein FMN transferase
VIFLFVYSCADNPQDRLVSFQGNTMGTTYSMKIIKDAGSQIAYEELKTKVDSVLREVNRQMSTYIPDSEISLFNKARAGDWFPISKDLEKVLLTAINVSELSGGAFDITVGPLVNLWGFGPEKKNHELPSPEEIADRKKFVGFQYLHVDSVKSAVMKDVDSLYCDLSAIAKGFGVDKVGKYFESLGVQNYMVEIGGEVRARGNNHKNEPWKIGISTPDSPSGIQEVISLSNYSMATSGDYRNYFEKDGVRFSHTIDPRTGKPITHNLASVSIMAENCMTADAVATAIDVLGPDEGMKLGNKMGLSVYMILRTDEGFDEKMNNGFSKLLVR